MKKRRFEKLADARGELETIIGHSPCSTSIKIYREHDPNSYESGEYLFSIYKQTEGEWEEREDDGSFQSAGPPLLPALEYGLCDK